MREHCKEMRERQGRKRRAEWTLAIRSERRTLFSGSGGGDEEEGDHEHLAYFAARDRVVTCWEEKRVIINDNV